MMGQYIIEEEKGNEPVTSIVKRTVPPRTQTSLSE